MKKKRFILSLLVFYLSFWGSSFSLVMAQSMTSVDLGLSVNWATCNLGATSPEQAGDRYAWGETMTKDEFSWSTLSLKWTEKYTTSDNLTQLQMSDDAAFQKLGDKWRMPTKEEFEELIANCSFKRTKRNGVDGSLLTSKKNGKSIFFPDVPVNGYNAAYWSSTVKIDNGRSQYAWYFNQGNEYWPPEVKSQDRYYGYVIRPVYDPKISSANNGSQTYSQQSISLGTTAEKEQYKDPVGVWKDKAAVIVFTLKDNGQANVKIFQRQSGTSPSYPTTWREKDGHFIIGGVGAVRSWILYPNGDLYALTESGVTEKVDIKLYKAY